MEIKESNLKKWTGTYNGVDFEINNWETEPNSVEPRKKDCWTYYLILRIERIPKEHKPKSYWLRGRKGGNWVMYWLGWRKDGNMVMYNYYKHPVLPNLDWHGGVTWYSKEHGFDRSEKIIRVGCDYMHHWDEGKYYNLDIVKRDVKRTIEKFLESVPNYKYWCCGNGNLYDLSEGIVWNGSFYSKEYWGGKDWFKSAVGENLITEQAKKAD